MSGTTSVEIEVGRPSQGISSAPPRVRWRHRELRRGVGKLTVISQPSDAIVYLDGHAIGQTPYAGTEVLAGAYEIEITKAGYEPVCRRIAIMPRHQTVERVVLQRAIGATVAPLDETACQRWTNPKDGSQMVHLPGGGFTMGSRGIYIHRDEEPAHDVELRAFSIGKYEVTNRQFRAFVDANPLWHKDLIGPRFARDRYLHDWVGDMYPPARADHPVALVSWFAAAAYCKWAGGRLPTEAEWEYACRAGSRTKYFFGNNDTELGSYAWYDGNSNGSAHPVGQKRPNPWGLHDMHGNVWEWCSSSYGSYPYTADDGRENPKDTKSRRVLRGGSWSYDDDGCRSGYRLLLQPAGCSSIIGFRMCVSSEAAG